MRFISSYFKWQWRRDRGQSAIASLALNVSLSESLLPKVNIWGEWTFTFGGSRGSNEILSTHNLLHRKFAGVWRKIVSSCRPFPPLLPLNFFYPTTPMVYTVWSCPVSSIMLCRRLLLDCWKWRIKGVLVGGRSPANSDPIIMWVDTSQPIGLLFELLIRNFACREIIFDTRCHI